MKRPHRNRSLVYALYANAAVLLVIFFSLVNHGGSGTLMSTASAAPAVSPMMTGNGSLFVAPAQFLNSVWGCYVLDTDNQILCAYQYNGNQLKLIASRNIRHDHQLNNYNTSPDPDEIRRLVDMEKSRIRGALPPPSANGSDAPKVNPDNNK